MPELLMIANSAALALASPMRTLSPQAIVHIAASGMRDGTAVVRDAHQKSLVRVRAIARSGSITLKLAQKR